MAAGNGAGGRRSITSWSALRRAGGRCRRDPQLAGPVHPRPLQTSEYALALIRILSPDDPEDVPLRRPQARITRRAVLERQDAPSYDVICASCPVGHPL
ncbi:Scr1 family TA system antitoxin-like transcriptional regulator [Actinomadura violacea]|uniref:Scr1 family TA system antitoxin-like transcriptional regulator n=1 Tax=Actinomadura violacea TaxID=2819934 RepID=UPI003557CDC3